MGKLNKNTIIVANTLNIGKCENVSSIINRLQSELNCIVNTKVTHDYDPFIIKDINVMSSTPDIGILGILDIPDTQVSIVIVLERLNKEKELTEIVSDIQNKVLKGEFNK